MQTSIEHSMRKKGLRMTHARRRILDILERVKHPMTVPDIERQFLQDEAPDRVTVYRQIHTLARVGIITRTDAIGRAQRYELNSEHHHHFVCDRCGNSFCLDESLNERFVASMTKRLKRQGLFVQEHSIVFSGECKVCHNT